MQQRKRTRKWGRSRFFNQNGTATVRGSPCTWACTNGSGKGVGSGLGWDGSASEGSLGDSVGRGRRGPLEIAWGYPKPEPPKDELEEGLPLTPGIPDGAKDPYLDLASSFQLLVEPGLALVSRASTK